ncbi:MAG TPA: serine hydrolase domain-containing protein [Acidimicrobiales bacterium]|nr:serine hydrolase domain-containing protein [Acidimicrobiales bacterium]
MGDAGQGGLDTGAAATAVRLQALVDRTVAKRRIAHAILGVARGDHGVPWIVAAGQARPGDPMGADTPFFVASITKRFIATLVLQAHERGELAIDDPIVALLPDELISGVHVLDGVDHTSTITVHHLLTHTSGLPDYFDKPRTGPSLFEQLAQGEDRSWTTADAVRWAREEHRPHFAPQDLSARRQKARYSDTGFQLLIAIVEQVTGRSFADLLHDRIFDRVGMAHTWLPGRSRPRADTPEPALIHAGRRPLDLPKMQESSNDLMSTAADLLRFQQALLRGDLFDQPATVARLVERANLLRNIPPNRYGVGTWIFRINRLVAPGPRPLTLIGHAGATGTWLFTCPELDVHLVGAVDQAAGQRMPFRIMLQTLRALPRV